MGRRVWSIRITVLLAAFGVGCGGSGGGPSNSGSQFVFEARGRLSLSFAQPISTISPSFSGISIRAPAIQPRVRIAELLSRTTTDRRISQLSPVSPPAGHGSLLRLRLR